MDTFTTENLRNVVLLAHSGAGKTSLAESLLFTTKAISRLGKIEDGTTVSDYDPEEQKRHTSLQLALAPSVWKGTKINVIDTPGFADFVGEQASALRVADAAVIVVSATGGVEVGTEVAWQKARDLGLPIIIFVSRLDREHADFEGTVAQIRSQLGNRCAAVNLPLGQEASFTGVVDLFGDVPTDLRDAADEAIDMLAEAVAETDDTLMEKFLDEGTLTADEIRQGLRVGVRSGVVVPVLAGSSYTSGGIEDLLDAIVDYLPSPADLGPASATKGDTAVELTADASGPLAAVIFKTAADPFVGKLSYFRVISGTMSHGDVVDARTGETERVAQVFVPVGKHQEHVDKVVAGDIGVVAKLAHAITGDTLTTKADGLRVAPVAFPAPVFKVAVHPKTKADLEKLSSSLARIVEEDPSLHMERDNSTGELVVTAMGDTHVEVMSERARRKFGVELALAQPRVAYRETISKITKVEYKHKKQSGGHGQYGHVHLRLEPMARGDGFSFASEVVGGNVPREYIPAVEKGVHKTMEDGAVAGYPIVDVKVVLVDGSFHAVDSSGQSFEIAGSMAMRKGMNDASPTLLEPIMKVTITVPEHSAGAVVGDLNTRRAHIAGMSPEGGLAVVEAEMPQVEAQQYSTQLRALTQGRGVISMEFHHYGEVPHTLVQKIVADHAASAAAGS